MTQNLNHSTASHRSPLLKLALLVASTLATLLIAELSVRVMPVGPRYRAEGALFNTLKMPQN